MKDILKIVSVYLISLSALSAQNSHTVNYIQAKALILPDSILNLVINVDKRINEVQNILSSTGHSIDSIPYVYTKLLLNIDTVGCWKRLNSNLFVKKIRISQPTSFGTEVVFDKFWLDTLDFVQIKNDSGKIIDNFSFSDNKNYNANRSSMINGQFIDIEIYTKSIVKYNSKIEISFIKAGLLALNFTGWLDNLSQCQVDVESHSSFANWSKAQNAVVMLVYDDPNLTYWQSGTGTLINNTLNDDTPYVITAGHNWHKDCTPFIPNSFTHTNTNGSYWKAYINYSGNLDNPNSMQFLNRRGNYILGAVPVAYMCSNDILLFRFEEKPDIRKKVHFAGWDLSSTNFSGAASIGHPMGAKQKILYGNSSGNSFFGSNTINLNGVFQPGQSGSAIFNPSNQIVGVFYFTSSNNSNASCIYDYSNPYPGKSTGTFNSILPFFYNNIIGPGNRDNLSYYLNPDNQNIQSLLGKDYCPQNQVNVSNGDIPTVFYRNGYRQVYKSVNWELTNWQNSMEVQASDYIRIKNSPTGHQNAIRITGGSTRMRAFACASNTNPQNRKESDENKVIDDKVTAKKLDLLWSAYPNPAKDNLALRFKTHGNYTITVISMQGKVVKQLETGETSDFNLSIADILNGVYQVAISNSEKIESIKLVKY